MGGSASIAAALADTSDTTFVDQSLTADWALSWADMDVANPTIPAGAKIDSVHSHLRARETTASAFRTFPQNWLRIIQHLGRGNRMYGTYDHLNADPSVFTDYSWGHWSTPDGKEWTAADVNNLILSLGVNQQSPNINWEVARARFEVRFNERPTVTVDSPTGTVTTTVRPEIRYTWADPEQDRQISHRVKIFTAAQYGAADFNPETSAPLWDSGEEFRGFLARTIDVDLVDGTTYRAYVKARQGWPRGRHESVWQSSTFTISLAVPPTPTLTVTPEAGSGFGPRVAVAVTAETDNLLTHLESSVEGVIAGTYANPYTPGPNTLTPGIEGAGYPGGEQGSESLFFEGSAAGDISVATTRFVPVKPATQYTLRASLYSAAARSARVDVQWFDAAQTLISTVTGTASTTSTTAWSPKTLTATSPANAAYAKIRPYVLAALASENHWADGLMIRPGASTAWVGGTDRFDVLVEYSDDGGAAWTVHPRLGGNVPDKHGTLTTHDYELPQDTSRRYRARSVKVLDTTQLASGYSSASADQTLDFTSWWLKDPENPTRNTRARINHPYSRTRREDQGVFWPLGRKTPVVVAGDLRSIEGELAMAFLSEAEWTAFEALRGGQKSVLLQHPRGGQMWVRLGGTVTETVIAERDDATPREVTVGFVEVDEPS